MCKDLLNVDTRTTERQMCVPEAVDIGRRRFRRMYLLPKVNTNWKVRGVYDMLSLDIIQRSVHQFRLKVRSD